MKWSSLFFLIWCIYWTNQPEITGASFAVMTFLAGMFTHDVLMDLAKLVHKSDIKE